MELFFYNTNFLVCSIYPSQSATHSITRIFFDFCWKLEHGNGNRKSVDRSSFFSKDVRRETCVVPSCRAAGRRAASASPSKYRVSSPVRSFRTGTCMYKCSYFCTSKYYFHINLHLR